MEGLEFQMLAKLGVVLLLVFPTLWVLRRWMGATEASGGRKVIHVVETQPLAEGQRLYLVRVQGRHLLLGGGKEGLSMLVELDDLELPAMPPTPEWEGRDQMARLMGALGARWSSWTARRSPAAEGEAR